MGAPHRRFRFSRRHVMTERMHTASHGDPPPPGAVRLEQLRSARLAATQILAQSATVDEAIPTVLVAVCDSLGWDVGAFWRVETDTIRCKEVRARTGVHVPLFEAATRNREFPLGT